MICNGRWYAEMDYSTYPLGQWCDKDRLANEIIKMKYRPKTSMENLVENIFDGMDMCEELKPYYFYYKVQDWLSFIEIQGGLRRFDTYEPIEELLPWPDDVPRSEPWQPPEKEKARMSPEDATKITLVIIAGVAYIIYVVLSNL